MSQNHPLLIDRVVHRVATMLTPQEAEHSLAPVSKFVCGVVVRARPEMQRADLINGLRGANGHPIYLAPDVQQTDPVLWQANQAAFDTFLLTTFMGDSGYERERSKSWGIEKASFMTLDFWVRMHVCLHALCRFWGFDLAGTFYIYGMRTPFLLNELPEFDANLLGQYMLPPCYVASHQSDPGRVHAAAAGLATRVLVSFHFEDCHMSPLTAWLSPTGNLATYSAWFHHCGLQSQDVRFLCDHRATWSSIHNINVHAYLGNPGLTYADMLILRELSDDPQDCIQLLTARSRPDTTNKYPLWNKYLHSCFMLDLQSWQHETLVSVSLTFMPIQEFFKSVGSICTARHLHDFSIEFHDPDHFFQGDPVPEPFVRHLHLCRYRRRPNLTKWRLSREALRTITIMFPDLRSLLIDDSHVLYAEEEYANMRQAFPEVLLPVSRDAWRELVRIPLPLPGDPPTFIHEEVNGEALAVRFVGE
jgi:hypothetical protein